MKKGIHSRIKAELQFAIFPVFFFVFLLRVLFLSVFYLSLSAELCFCYTVSLLIKCLSSFCPLTALNVCQSYYFFTFLSYLQSINTTWFCDVCLPLCGASDALSIDFFFTMAWSFCQFCSLLIK